MTKDSTSKLVPLIALLCLVGAVASLLPQVQVRSDSNVPIYFVMLALAAMAWPSIQNLKFGKDGVSLEKFETMRAEVRAIDKAVTELNTASETLGAHVSALADALEQVRLGNKELKLLLDELRRSADGQKAESNRTSAPSAPSALSREINVANDPQKGRWGGKPEANGWQLSGAVKPSALDSAMYVVELTVKSTMANRSLRGGVSFFVHDTFPQERYDVRPHQGNARLELRAWGAFTVGAWIEEDATELELDLAELEGAPQRFLEL